MAENNILKILTGRIKKNKHPGRSETASGLLFMAPFFTLMILFFIVVIVYGFIISMKDAQGGSIGGFIGFENYKLLLNDRYFWNTVLTNFGITFACLATQIPVSFFLANWLNSLPYKRIQAVLLAAFFVPFLMTAIVIGGTFRHFFEGDPAFINWLLGLLHLPHNFNWLIDSNLAVPMIVFVSFWQMAGFQTAYFLTNLQAINPDLYEEAKIDGASAWQIIRHIKLPLLRPAFSFMMVMSVISSLTLYELVFVLIPNFNVTTILMYMVGRAFYGDLNLGATTAAGMIFFIIILAVSLVQIRLLGLGKPHEE